MNVDYDDKTNNFLVEVDSTRHVPPLYLISGVRLVQGTFVMPGELSQMVMLHKIGRTLDLEVEWSSEAEKRKVHLVDTRRLAIDIRDREILEGIPVKRPSNVARGKYIPEFMPHQVRAAHILNVAGSGLLTDQTGLGKTITAILWMNLGCFTYYSERGSLSLVVVPKHLINKWKESIHEFWIDDAECAPLVVWPIVGAADRRRHLLNYWVDGMEDGYHSVAIINYESLFTIDWTKLLSCRRGAKESYDILNLVYDECHRLSNYKSRQTRAAHHTSIRAERVLAMSATPTRGELSQIWPIYKAVWPREFQHRDKFIQRYTISLPGPFGGYDTAGWNPDNYKELRQIVGYRTVDRSWDDPEIRASVGEESFPPDIVDVDIPLSKEQVDQYTTLREHIILKLESGNLVWPTTHMHAVWMLRLCTFGVLTDIDVLERFVDEYIKDKDEPRPANASRYGIAGLQYKSSNKMKAILDMLSDYKLGSKHVIYTSSIAVAEYIAKTLDNTQVTSFKVYRAWGSTKADSVLDLIRISDDTTSTHVLVTTFSKMSEGVDMDFMDSLIMAQVPSWLVEYVQALGRVRRITNKISIPVYRLFTPGTVDDRTIASLAEKLDNHAAILELGR